MATRAVTGAVDVVAWEAAAKLTAWRRQPLSQGLRERLGRTCEANRRVVRTLAPFAGQNQRQGRTGHVLRPGPIRD